MKLRGTRKLARSTEAVVVSRIVMVGSFLTAAMR